MTDAVPIEEPVPPVPLAPEAIAEVDGAPPQAAPAEALAEPVPPAAEAVAEVEAAPPLAEVPAERAMPEIEYPIGPLRQAVLDALADADEPLSVSRIIAEMPVGTSRGSAESAIKREYDAGRIERVAPGVYRLAPTKPSEPKPPPPEPVRSDGISDDQWLTWLGDWRAGGKWDAPGNPPGHPGCAVPPSVIAKHNERVRKRLERQREREAAQARQSAADRELRDRLIAATGGNIIRGPGIEDVSPIRAALELVPIDRIVCAIRSKTDKKMYPGNEPATSWREERLLREIAECYFRSIIQPHLVAAWAAAGKTPAPTAQSSPPADGMPDDIDELRSRHDQENVPAGPHVMSQLAAAPDVPREAAGAFEPPAATRAAPEPENASAMPPKNGSRPPDDSVAEPPPLPDGAPDVAAAAPVVSAPPPDDGGPVVAGRAAVLAAFNRPRQPQPAPRS
jgi:hypothetical protein